MFSAIAGAGYISQLETITGWLTLACADVFPCTQLVFRLYMWQAFFVRRTQQTCLAIVPCRERLKLGCRPRAVSAGAVWACFGKVAFNCVAPLQRLPDHCGLVDPSHSKWIQFQGQEERAVLAARSTDQSLIHCITLWRLVLVVQLVLSCRINAVNDVLQVEYACWRPHLPGWIELYWNFTCVVLLGCYQLCR